MGCYTVLLSGLVGPKGTVVAWEPSPANLSQLRPVVAAFPNVVVKPAALGDETGSALLQQGSDHLGASSRIVDHIEPGRAEPSRIEIVTGDHAVSSGHAPAPAVIKIDTEGFELQVLRGLRATASSSSHGLRGSSFGILRERRLPNAASEIERIFDRAGFGLRWTDSSHLIASRVG